MQIFRKHPVFHPETAWIKPSFLRHNNSDAPLLKREAKFQSGVIVMAMNLPTILTGAGSRRHRRRNFQHYGLKPDRGRKPLAFCLYPVFCENFSLIPKTTAHALSEPAAADRSANRGPPAPPPARRLRCGRGEGCGKARVPPHSQCSVPVPTSIAS